MKKILSLLLVIILVTGTMATAAESAEDFLSSYQNAETLDRQLEILSQMAEQNAAELETGGWNSSWNTNPASGLPENLIPANWEETEYTEAAAFPEEMRGRRFIAFKRTENGELLLYGDLLARLPADMRAPSLAEAEFALVLVCWKKESGIKYTIPTTSYNRTCAAYILEIGTGEITRFWQDRHSARYSGYANELDGKPFTDQEIWESLRSQIWGQFSMETEDGSELIFGISGSSCFLLGCKGKPVTMEVPAEVNGYVVAEISEAAFGGIETLTDITLPEGITAIRKGAFNSCTALEHIHLPETLKSIGEYAFFNCDSLRQIELPDSIVTISDNAFKNCDNLEGIRLPAKLIKLGEEAFRECNKLAWIIVPDEETAFDYSAFFWDQNLTCIYVPASFRADYWLTGLAESAVICAPKGSPALEWGTENGYETIACESPEEMPRPEYRTEDDYEVLLFRETAAIAKYLGDADEVTIPETALGVPVTAILYHAFYAADEEGPTDIWISDPELEIRYLGILRSSTSKKTTLVHAPGGSKAAQYISTTLKNIGGKIGYMRWN